MGRAWLFGVGLLLASDARAEVLTVEHAVQLALGHNLDAIRADASVLDARGGLYSAYSSVLPSVSASITRTSSITKNETGFQSFAGTAVPIEPNDSQFNSTTPSLSASWNALRLSSWASLSSARRGVAAAGLSREATRSQVALDARRGFYDVVKAIKLEDVAGSALRLARDDERRVRALFEVGSVSRSDLLKARVRTSQSELDSLTASQTVVSRRNALASLLGMKESALGEVDTVLTAVSRPVDEAAVLHEASRANPDLRAAKAELQAARANRLSARLARLPYVTAGGSIDINPSQDFTSTNLENGIESGGKNENDQSYGGQIALRWDVFDGLLADARNASANARLLRAQETHDALERNLSADVHLAVLTHRQAIEQYGVAQEALESATENLKLTQQKYNVGSATILELIDAQVQLQRAQSDVVSALAAIRVAEAQLNRVQGRAQ
jgi:outer membrane protein TolC